MQGSVGCNMGCHGESAIGDLCFRCGRPSAREELWQAAAERPEPHQTLPAAAQTPVLNRPVRLDILHEAADCNRADNYSRV